MTAELYPADVETVTIVRERYDEDGDPVGRPAEIALPGCQVVARLPAPDQHTTGERVVTTFDVRHPDRGADVRATDRVRRAGEDPNTRARWAVDGAPARSPFRDGGCLFVIQREDG